MRESAPVAKGNQDAISRNLGPTFKLNTVHCNTTVAHQDFIMPVLSYMRGTSYAASRQFLCMGIFSAADSAEIMTYKFFKASLKCWACFLPG